MKILFLLFFASLFAVSIASVYAETTHVVTIPSGAASPSAPYFWSVQTTGNTDGLVIAHLGDTVRWENADIVEHNVAATTLDGQGTLFFSDFIDAGDNFSFTFNEIGVYEYSCPLHPWMTGVVNVIQDPGNVRTIKNVASGFSTDGTGFDVKYFLDTPLSNDVRVDPNQKTITFFVEGSTQNDEIKLTLHEELISDPSAVWLDGIQTTNFNIDSSSDGTILTIPIKSSPKEITIMGSHVIPEFGHIVLLILVVSITVTIIATKKSNLVRI